MQKAQGPGVCRIKGVKYRVALQGGTWDFPGQMVNTEIRLIIFFAAKDGEAIYSQQKQDQELTVAQMMNSLLPNSPADGMFQQASMELGREIWETGGLPGFSAAQGWFSPV